MTELRTGKPVVVGDVTMVPVEEVSVQSWAGPRGFGATAFKRPVAVVITMPTGKQVFELTNAPGLAHILDRLT